MVSEMLCPTWAQSQPTCYPNIVLPVLVVHATKSLLDRKRTSLVFLPGKSEIASVLKDLVAAGVAKELIVPFHADLDVDVIEEAKRGTKDARIMLSTSLAETSITLPDVDVVIDLGLSRRCFLWIRFQCLWIPFFY